VVALFGGPGHEAEGVLAAFTAPFGPARVDVLDPGDAGAHGEDEGRPDRQQADLGAALGQVLAEGQDQGEGDRRDQGDDPRVFEEPVHACPSPS